MHHSAPVAMHAASAQSHPGSYYSAPYHVPACRLLDREEKQKKAVYSRGVAKAQAMATALKTIGKFTITKRAGAEGKIFGRYVLLPDCLAAWHWLVMPPAATGHASEMPHVARHH